ncbi:MAG: squalene--hopene cyclase, partial [Pirellulaceae bacterium]|nr:squalene--hopene cyclase [Pirellulaceae bacterium]
MLDFDRLRAAYEQAKGELLAERTPDGHWVGELSSSALSTATAVSALAVVRKNVGGRKSKVERREGVAAATFDLEPSTFDDLIARGVAYLAGQQNDDGGFGDTDLSHSNIATTYLVVAALHLAGAAKEHRELLARADAYLESKGRLAGLRERYGIDKTFVVPIMTNLAIAGLLDWREIDQLPFELATVPQAWYRFVGMPVVSYAIPALVAIGQAQFHHAPPWNPLTRLVRWLSITRSLKVLRRMQPDSGGYLEATPLTSFVVMSLASVGRSPIAAEVIEHGVRFLVDSIRPDGSWPIDTNLATWNTTLAINALAGAGEDVAELLGVNTIVRNVFDGVYDDP